MRLPRSPVDGLNPERPLGFVVGGEGRVVSLAHDVEEEPTTLHAWKRRREGQSETKNRRKQAIYNVLSFSNRLRQSHTTYTHARPQRTGRPGPFSRNRTRTRAAITTGEVSNISPCGSTMLLASSSSRVRPKLVCDLGKGEGWKNLKVEIAQLT